MTLQDFLSRLDGVKRSGSQYVARCPFHDDRQQSLSVAQGDKGIVLTCHAGCSMEDITGALGLSVRDLFNDQQRDSGALRQEAEYIYYDDQGKPLLKKVKLRKADGGKSFYWQRQTVDGWDKGRGGIAPPLYNQSSIATGETVFLVEGEKDVDTLKAAGWRAVSTADGAAGKWRDEYTAALTGCQVVILEDNDKAGHGYAASAAAALHGKAASVKVLDLTKEWPQLPEHGDISDIVKVGGTGDTFPRLLALENRTPEWMPAGATMLTPMTTVEAKKASYLISPYLPRGMLVVMGGVSGMGKTWLALSWAAAVSKGQRLPFQKYFEAPPPAGYVYYFTQENDPNTVIRPRLDLMDANLDKILIQAQTGATYDPITLNDHRLEEATELYPPSLIIFDPIQSYLGAKVEMNKANEVRPILDWLGDYCKRHDCTTILVSHMSKPGMGNSAALDRLLGSSDFRNAARSIIIVGGDPEDKESRVFAHAKNSIGIPGPSQRYHIDGTRGVVYDGECDLTADDLVKQAQPGARAKPAVTITQARRMLEELLGVDGFATIEQVETLQMTAGISQRTFYNARKEMALQTVSIGKPPERQIWWLLPEVDTEKFKQAHTPPPEQLNIAK